MSDAIKTAAIVDLGSVSTQLLITDGDRRVRRTVDTVMGGSSMSSTGTVRSEVIDGDALERVERALVDFAAIIAGEDADAVRAVGTAAARRARNREELELLVRRVIGVDLDVIDPAHEAHLAFAGAVDGSGLAPQDPGDPVLTIDIGGGSTEFALGTGAGPSGGCSLPIGGALLSATYLTSDPPRPEELSAALSVVELHIDDVHRALPTLAPLLEHATVIGVGAVTTIAAVEIGLTENPNNGEGDGPLHSFELTRHAVEDVFRTIATEIRSDRAFNPGLPPTRVDDIVGACALLVETMRQLDLDRIVVSQRGIMDGIANEMLSPEG